MSDTDSYLLKCALEELEKGKELNLQLINEECACKYGYSDQTDLTTTKGE
jgi:hypothetical protein